MSTPDNHEIFSRIDPPRTLTADEEAMNSALQAYEERFGYLPLGIGIPEPTIAELLDAVKTGNEITESIQPGAVA